LGPKVILASRDGSDRALGPWAPAPACPATLQKNDVCLPEQSYSQMRGHLVLTCLFTFQLLFTRTTPCMLNHGSLICSNMTPICVDLHTCIQNYTSLRQFSIGLKQISQHILKMSIHVENKTRDVILSDYQKKEQTVGRSATSQRAYKIRGKTNVNDVIDLNQRKLDSCLSTLSSHDLAYDTPYSNS
jgi:hypothetical protein